MTPLLQSQAYTFPLVLALSTLYINTPTFDIAQPGFLECAKLSNHGHLRKFLTQKGMAVSKKH